MSINFHIPDFVRHLRLNMLICDMIKRMPQYFREDIAIGSCYGAFPGMMWNGGRFFAGKTDDMFIKQVIKVFNTSGIPIRFTFTNPLIKEEHLNDPFCNSVLKLAQNGLNEVIVMSPVLEEYIRSTYPQYPIISSTCKQIKDPEALGSELEKDYKMVVLDYNFNNNYEFLEKIPHKDKCEILVNAACIPNCPRRGEHYESIGRDQIRLARHESNAAKNKLPPFEPCDFTCEYMLRPIYEPVETRISPDDLYGRYVPMGFSNFKIEGRSVTDINLAEAYVFYMMKPEMRDKGRIELLLALTKNTKYFT